MKLGIIGRADSRGIAHQSQMYAEALKPAKVLCVMLGDKAWPEDAGRWPGRHVIFVQHDRRDGTLNEHRVRQFLKDLDVVLAVETVYDWRLCDWAREAGVRTVVVGNPEFYSHWQDIHAERPHPDKWVWPTDWLLDRMPSTTVLPVPCVERPQVAADPDAIPLKILHVAGHAAAGDRNGTTLFAEAVPLLKSEVEVTIVGQDGWLPPIHLPGKSRARIKAYPKGVEDRWEMYRDKHLLVAPRRYGGLSLPTIEAISCGVPAMMPNCPPNKMWPGPRIEARMGRLHHAPGGRVPTTAVAPRDIARAIDILAERREVLARHMEEAQHFARTNSWDAWRDRYLEVLS